MIPWWAPLACVGVVLLTCVAVVYGVPPFWPLVSATFGGFWIGVFARREAR